MHTWDSAQPWENLAAVPHIDDGVTFIRSDLTMMVNIIPGLQLVDDGERFEEKIGVRVVAFYGGLELGYWDRWGVDGPADDETLRRIVDDLSRKGAESFA